MKEAKTRHKRLFFLLVAFFAAILLPVFSASPQAGEYLRKARVFFIAENYPMARDYLQRAQKLDPSDTDIDAFSKNLQTKIDERIKELRQRADFFLDAKNSPEAEKLLVEVLALSADDENARIKLKEIAEVNQQIDEYKNQGINIQTSTGRSHDLDSYSAISHMNRARGFFAQGDRVNAMMMINKVLKREPGYKPALELKERIDHINDLESFIEKAETAFFEGRMRETVDSLNALIAQTPDRHEYFLMRGKAHIKLKNFDKAKADLWKYFQYNPDEDIVFPLLSDAYYGQKEYLLANAFSQSNKSGKIYKPLFYRFQCRAYAFPWQYAALTMILLLIPFATYFVWTSAEAIFQRFSMGSAGMALSCIFTIMLKSPEHCLGNLTTVARDLNVAWVNYLTGITLLKIGQIEGAQRFLAFSFVNAAIRPRAYYFFGLTRKLLKYNLYELDFEESVLSGLSLTKSGWHPNFVKKIERELLISYSKEKTDETFEGMAYKLVEDVTGGLK